MKLSLYIFLFCEQLHIEQQLLVTNTGYTLMDRRNFDSGLLSELLGTYCTILVNNVHQQRFVIDPDIGDYVRCELLLQ